MRISRYTLGLVFRGNAIVNTYLVYIKGITIGLTCLNV